MLQRQRVTNSTETIQRYYSSCSHVNELLKTRMYKNKIVVSCYWLHTHTISFKEVGCGGCMQFSITQDTRELNVCNTTKSALFLEFMRDLAETWKESALLRLRCSEADNLLVDHSWNEHQEEFQHPPCFSYVRNLEKKKQHTESLVGDAEIRLSAHHLQLQGNRSELCQIHQHKGRTFFQTEKKMQIHSISIQRESTEQSSGSICAGINSKQYNRSPREVIDWLHFFQVSFAKTSNCQ